MVNSAPSTPTQEPGVRPAVATPWTTSTIAHTTSLSERSRRLFDVRLEVSDDHICVEASEDGDLDGLLSRPQPLKSNQLPPSAQSAKNPPNRKTRSARQHQGSANTNGYLLFPMLGTSSPDRPATEKTLFPEISPKHVRSSQNRVQIESIGLQNLTDTDRRGIHHGKRTMKAGEIFDWLDDGLEGTPPRRSRNTGPQQQEKPKPQPAPQRPSGARANIAAKLAVSQEPQLEKKDPFALPESPQSSPQNRTRGQPRRGATTRAPKQARTAGKQRAKRSYAEPAVVEDVPKAKEKASQRAGNSNTTKRPKPRQLKQATSRNEAQGDKNDAIAAPHSQKTALCRAPVQVISSGSDTTDPYWIGSDDSAGNDNTLAGKNPPRRKSPNIRRYNLREAVAAHPQEVIQEASTKHVVHTPAAEVPADPSSTPAPYSAHHSSDIGANDRTSQVPLPVFEKRIQDPGPQSSLDAHNTGPLIVSDDISHQDGRPRKRESRQVKRPLPPLSSNEAYPQQSKKARYEDTDAIQVSETTAPIENAFNRRSLTDEMLEEFSQHRLRESHQPVEASTARQVQQSPRTALRDNNGKVMQQAWEEESEPYGEIRKTTGSIIKRILRYLKSQEDAVDDVSDEYQKRGNHLLEKLGKRHGNERRELVGSFERQRASFTKVCGKANANMGCLAQELAGIDLTKITNSLEGKEASSQLQALKGELGMSVEP